MRNNFNIKLDERKHNKGRTFDFSLTIKNANDVKEYDFVERYGS